VDFMTEIHQTLQTANVKDLDELRDKRTKM